MNTFALLGTLILGWSLGKNNLSNLFGTAIGTGMIRLKSAALLAVLFLFIGAFFSGSATTSTVLSLSVIKSTTDIIVVLLSAAFILEMLSLLGIPASIVQTIIGSLLGWNIFHHIPTDWKLVIQMVGAWFWAPLIALGISCLLIKIIRKILTRYPISIFKRDALIRIGLILAGISASYSLGANNTGTITGPFLSVFPTGSSYLITACVCTFIGLGFLMADQKVIATVGRRLFPLTPTEALIVMIGTTLSMFCFSLQGLKDLLHAFHLPAFPLVPIPISNVMIGSILGISAARGGKGLRFSVLGRIFLSWFFVPVAAAVSCITLLLLGTLL